jgi:hypothetical protein
VSGRSRALRLLPRSGVVGLTLVAAGGAALADSAADLARCAAISAPDERLACYDALAGLKPSRSPPAAAGPRRATGADGDAESFAPLRHPPPAAAEGPKQIKALIAEVSVDRLGNVLVSLDNGQSWTFNDPNALLRRGDTVTIRRAALGSFLLTAGRHSYRAQRLQ